MHKIKQSRSSKFPDKSSMILVDSLYYRIDCSGMKIQSQINRAFVPHRKGSHAFCNILQKVIKCNDA